MAKYLLAPVFLAVFFIGGRLWNSAPAEAQSLPPQVLVNWQTNTYVPSEFEGKALPSSESVITVGADLIDRGRLVDPSSQRVYWYVNGTFYQGGPGFTRVTLRAPRFVGSTSIQLRVSFPDYAGGPAKTINIPVVVPEVVVSSSAPSLAASATPFTLQVQPYFFNIQDPSELNFSWSLNGGTPVAQNPFTVTNDMAGSGRPATLELRVQNPLRLIERIAREITLFPSSN